MRLKQKRAEADLNGFWIWEDIVIVFLVVIAVAGVGVKIYETYGLPLVRKQYSCQCGDGCEN